MMVQLTPTGLVVPINGASCQVWTGYTKEGVRVNFYVAKTTLLVRSAVPIDAASHKAAMEDRDPASTKEGQHDASTPA